MTAGSCFVYKSNDQVAETNTYVLEKDEWTFSMSPKWLLKKPLKRSIGMLFILLLGGFFIYTSFRLIFSGVFKKSVL